MASCMRKAPDDQLDYDVDFSRWLPDSDSLASVTATADTGLDVLSASISGQVAKVWLAGGTLGVTYGVDVTVTTAEGRIKTESFNLRIMEC